MNLLYKEIKIPKENLLYFFIGGMTYNTKFSFDTGSKNHYPFTTYFIERIEDVFDDGLRYKSLFYCKLPLICFQFEDKCKCIELGFPPEIKGRDMPFIGLQETDSQYILKIRQFPFIKIRKKKEAWLGLSKKEKIKTKSVDVKIREFEDVNWESAVLRFYERQKIESQKLNIPETSKIKKALFRSYDDVLGTFLQMPWRNTTGFSMDKYSYSLLGFEAKRLNYFYQLYKKTGDPDYKKWVSKLELMFFKRDFIKETENGDFWYNMTHFDGKKLKGFSYLNVGYAGYPPGQATISFNISSFMKESCSMKLSRPLLKNIDYILNTQNNDGSWPAAIPMKFSNRKWKKSEGSTAQSVRALLSTYRLFRDDRYKESALMGLEYLKKENIICRNVLRDIGIDEPEAFSAIIIVDAFIDAYELFGGKINLDWAEKYAVYMLTWHYFYGNLKGFFHPISESITPRISPYESLMAVKTYHRLYSKTNKKIWKDVSEILFSRILELVGDDYSLPEGIFPKIDGSLSPISMYQTFATTELLHACMENSSTYTEEKIKEPIDVKDINDEIVLGDFLRINKKRMEINSGDEKFEIIFHSPYSLKNKIKTKLSLFFRRFGVLNISRDIGHVFNGIGPKKKKIGRAESISDYMNNYHVKVGENEVILEGESDFHRIFMKFYKKKKICADLTISVKKHDLICDKVIINGKDYTLDTNWTNGGIFKKTFIFGE